MRNRTIVFISFFLASLFTLVAADNTPPRTISVTGSAEKTFDPDRLFVTIGYGEYWEEEFEEGTEWKDFRTKVPIGKVEPNIIAALDKLGFKDEDITVQSAGNNYRQQGKDFLIKKSLELKIEEFSKMNEILAMMDMRGIDMVNIGRMELDNLEDARLEVKLEALEAAKYKADKMVKALGGELGKVMSISESGSMPNNHPYMANRMMAMEMKDESSEYVSPLDNFREMKIKQSMSVIFLIK
jgi:uncharacterized protein YggE